MINEEKILEGLRKACARGWIVMTNLHSANYELKRGCALSVAAVGLGHTPLNYREAGHVMGLTPTEVFDFARSFDCGIGPCGLAIALRNGCIDGSTLQVIR